MKKPKKKNRKKHGSAAAAEALDRSEQYDELLALSAIYGDDLEIREDRQGFRLLVQPHPGEAEANHVWLYLTIMCVIRNLSLFISMCVVLCFQTGPRSQMCLSSVL